MKRNILIAAVLFGGTVLMTACEKENQPSGIPEGGLMLTTEGYSSDSKTVVEGNTVHWRNRDEVIINGSRYKILTIMRNHIILISLPFRIFLK